ncbi:3-isopropylmalate dehydratase large subunit [Alistipes sp. ZOR0009]|uniref:3-isopropylmalate dehydratase large subunit n=1 Tax=Alistipes sp. ZOR0009 TaxID=1339253 RepID=UPI000648C276|nr:3-isopropylmalate dehydratase large subunit [Alistipes sp. ZOR0009]
MGKTLFDKIWDAHVVHQNTDGADILYIDRHFIHEVTSPQAFDGLKKRGIGIFRPQQTVATADHNVPTTNQHLPIVEEQSRKQVTQLIQNCNDFGLELYGLGHPYQGIVHIIGPELGITQPGSTYVCGDSHTATHGAFGSIAFGIGTSEVEMVFASQTLPQVKPKTMRITVSGTLEPFVTAKDVILYIISKLSAKGGTGFFVEYAGEAIRSLSMEGRMTICNMSIEMGARGGLIAPDKTTFEYIKNRPFAPKNSLWDKAQAYWETLYTDEDALFDAEYTFDASEIKPMVTYGTNPGMGIAIDALVPYQSDFEDASDKLMLKKALEYMDFHEGQSLEGLKISHVFIGSCTNGRIEDFRAAAKLIKGKKVSSEVTAWFVPGSKQVEAACKAEGITQIFEEAGIYLRQPGCSACLAMNEDKVPAGKYCVSTSNRNFEGRQGPGARTILASPLTAAAAAIMGVITDPRKLA